MKKAGNLNQGRSYVITTVNQTHPASTYDLTLQSNEWKMGQIFLTFPEYLNFKTENAESN